MKRLLLLLLLAILSLLGACSSPPMPITSYSLLSNAVPDKVGKVDTGLLVELPKMPLPLAGLGIVYQKAHSLVEAQQHVWEEDVRMQFARKLMQDLNGQALPVEITPATTLRGAANAAPRLRVKINEFYGDYRGKAVLAGEWVFTAADKLAASPVAFYISESLQADGYPALVAALSACIETLAGQIARTVSPLYA